MGLILKKIFVKRNWPWVTSEKVMDVVPAMAHFVTSQKVYAIGVQ